MSRILTMAERLSVSDIARRLTLEDAVALSFRVAYCANFAVTRASIREGLQNDIGDAWQMLDTERSRPRWGELGKPGATRAAFGLPFADFNELCDLENSLRASRGAA